MVTFHHTETTCPVSTGFGLKVKVQPRCGIGGVTVTVAVHELSLNPLIHWTLSVYVVVVAGVSIALPFQLGYVNAENSESAGVNVAFTQLVYEAEIVTGSPAVIVEALAVIVQPAVPVRTVHDPNPVQSFLQ